MFAIITIPYDRTAKGFDDELLNTFLVNTIHDPKERLISVAPFRDRVVHHAMVNVLEPVVPRAGAL